TAFRAGAGVSVDVHSVSSLGLGGFGTPSLQGGPDEQRGEELHIDQETIESLRRAYEAFSRGDFDTAMEMVHPEVELVRPGGQKPLKGAAAMRAWMEPDAFEKQTIEMREFRINGNKVLVRHYARVRGAGSGIEVEDETWVLWTLNDDGLVTQVVGFLLNEEAEALEAAGLSE
ncbi:MAG: nuclear transport factor 2 family protein, partial [Solirubrobacterales bacterium]